MEGEKFENLSEEDKLCGETKEKVDKLLGLGARNWEIINNLHAITRKLRNTYPDHGKYLLYHVISGSSHNRSDCPNFDFPGDDSAAKQIDDLYEKYKTEEQA